jgi:hypothetical protein
MSLRSFLWPALVALTLAACAEGGGYRVIGASAGLDTSRGLTASTYDEQGSFEVIDDPQDGAFADEGEFPEEQPPPRRRR